MTTFPRTQPYPKSNIFKHSTCECCILIVLRFAVRYVSTEWHTAYVGSTWNWWYCKTTQNSGFLGYSCVVLDINTTHSTCLDTLELITYADLFPRRYVFGNKSAIFPFLGRSRVWMYILRQFVSMIWFVIESQELSFHAFLFDAIILVRIPEQTHFRWQNQND